MKIFLIITLFLFIQTPAFSKQVESRILAKSTMSWDGSSLKYPKGSPELTVQKIIIHAYKNEIQNYKQSIEQLKVVNEKGELLS